MAINVSTLESNLTTKINNTSGTTEAKEFLLLGKAVESINTAVSNTSLQPSNNLSDVADAATARSNLGVDTYVTTQINGLVDSAPGALDTLNELAAALGDDANFSTTVTNSIATKMPSAGGTFTGDISIGDHTHILQDDDLKFVAPSSTVGIQDARIAWWNETEAGIMAMIAVDRTASTLAPADLVFYTTSSVDSTANNGEGDRTERLRITSDDEVQINSALKIREVKENVNSAGGITGAVSFDIIGNAVLAHFTNATANWTLNFRGNSATTLNSIMSNNESITVTQLASMGTTAYYPTAFQVDGTAVTPKWSGGSAPTAGNASGIDVYTFTIIKTADATFTVLASQTQYA